MKLLNLSDFPALGSVAAVRAKMAALASKRVGGVVDPEAVGRVGRFCKAADLIPEANGWIVEGVATTDDVDSDDEVVVPSGIDWKILDSFKTLYLEHVMDFGAAVATLRYVKRFPDKSTNPRGWVLRARMLPEDSEPAVTKLLAMIREGAMGFSIGFLADDRGRLTPEEQKRYPNAKSIVRKCRVFECSFTTHPCNLSARVNGLYVDDSKAAQVLSLVRKGVLPAEYGRAYTPSERAGRKVLFVP